VFIALARMGFLPRALERRNKWRVTPHWSILVAVGMPVAITIGAQAQVNLLGDLYAFGLLGTFVLTCVSLDVVRWRERPTWTAGQAAIFAIGVLTTILVVTAWLVNLVYKPSATKFGGGLTVVGLVIGLLTYRYYRSRRPSVFPVSFRPQRAAASIATALGNRPSAGELLVILPHDQLAAEAVLRAATRAAAGRGAVFLYRGDRYPNQHHELLEVADPYLRDFSAHDAFSRAEMLARDHVKNRRYVYMPGSLPREMVGEVWRTVAPKETLVTVEDQGMLPPMAVDRVRRHTTEGVTVLHMYTSKVRPAHEVEAVTA
jgi:hypothetical protein